MDPELMNGAELEGQIFWDSYGLENPYSGVARYAFSLLDSLQALGIRPILVGTLAESRSKTGDSLLTLDPMSLLAPIADSKLIRPHRVQNRLLTTLNLKEIQSRPVVLHGLSNINLCSRRKPTQGIRKVITIHDLIPLLAPRSVSWTYYLQFKYLLPKVADAADRIICVSSWTSRSVQQLFPQHAHKVLTIRNGFPPIDPSQKFDQPLPTTGSKLNLVSVARFEQYKGFDLLRNILFKRANEFRLVLVTDQNGLRWAEREAKALVNTGALRVVSGIPDDELRELYRQSHAMIHPSQFEGFCLPAAECLASGTPVVYVAGSGLDETVGSKVGVPMKRTASVFDWISGIEYAASFKYRQQYIRDLALHLDQRPTWQQAAQQLSAVYRDLLG